MPGDIEGWIEAARAETARSSLAEPRFEAVKAALENAIEAAPAERRGAVRRDAAQLLLRAALAFDASSTEKFLARATERAAWSAYLERCAAVLAALDGALSLEPSAPAVLEAELELCSRLLRGMTYPEFCDYWLFRERQHAVSDEYALVLRRKLEACAAELAATRPEPVSEGPPSPRRPREG